MDHNQGEPLPMQILQTPSQSQIQVAAEWLSHHPHHNPDLEIALYLILQGQIVPHERGGLVAIAHMVPTAANGWGSQRELTRSDIQGILMARADNANVSIVSSNEVAAAALAALMLARGCPRRLVTSGPDKSWIRASLLQHYPLQREYDQQVMICTQPPGGAGGRWAVPSDKPALQAYASAYLAERGTGRLDSPWDDWIQRRRVAVLEHQGQIVAMVRRGETLHCAIVVSPFTFAPFRRQGFARRLLAFFIQEMLQEFPAVKLWVDEDNSAAMALYTALDFRPIGTCYTGYFGS